MDRDQIAQLGASRLADLLLFYGRIVRSLDADCEWLEYWTQDGNYINDIAFDSGPVHHVELTEELVKGNWESAEQEMKRSE